MKIDIKDHAVEQYIRRVMGIDPDEATEHIKISARQEIILAVDYPDDVYHGRKEMAQIHLRNGAGVVVGVNTEVDGKLRPYTDEDNEFVVPTVYDSSVFRSKLNEQKETAQTQVG